VYGLRRVVITGTGMVSPLACGVDATWRRILAGQSGVTAVDNFDVSDLPTKIAAQVPVGDGSDDTFNADDWMEPREQRRVDDFIIYAVAAAQQAVDDADWKPEAYEDQIRTGVLVGSGIGGLVGIEQTSLLLADKGPRKISPFFLPGRLTNLAPGHISIRFGFKGPNLSVVTACSSGAHAIGDAARMIALNEADVMLAGGTESAVSRLGIAGFVACRALSTHFNDTPQAASRPYDKDRDGFVMADGAGIVVLEELEHARARGANIYAEVIGYGLSGDAFHITAPDETGDGGFRCMKAALNLAGIEPSEIDYVNAHGTSTPLGDEIELGSVTRLFDGKVSGLSMSSTKSAIGHLLGAAGTVEAIFSALAIRDNVAPPTLNLDNPSIETEIDLVPHKAREREINVVLTNSFGFGGTNASLILRRISE